MAAFVTVFLRFRWMPALGLGAMIAMAAPTNAAGGAPGEARPRVIVSTDIGGQDPDDIQSFVHYLVYADRFETEGLISSPPGDGRVADIHRVLDAYAVDLPVLRRQSAAYPALEHLRAGVKQGAIDPAPPAGHGAATEGSRWIAERARAPSNQPLWILVWGSLTDVAQALHDAPDIAPRVRLYSIGSWNTAQDPAARDYLWQRHPGLWWIESDSTFRGMYLGGERAGDLGNVTFVERHVRGRGALGRVFWAAKPDIKMGDTPSVLYLLHGNPLQPDEPSWGGHYVVPLAERPTYWHDDPDPAAAVSGRAGAAHVARWREAYLRDWQARMKPLPATDP